jgi:hypothetical protein
LVTRILGTRSFFFWQFCEVGGFRRSSTRGFSKIWLQLLEESRNYELLGTSYGQRGNPNSY